MVDKQKLFNVNPGDPSIPAKTLNGVIQVANIFNQSGFDGNDISYFYDDGITRQVSFHNDDDDPADTPDYEFKVVKESLNTVSVVSGHWIRNGYDASNDAAAAVEILVVPDGTDQYLVVDLDQTGVYDPTLHPSTLTYDIEATEPTEDTYDEKMVIARINTTATSINEVIQIRTGGRKEDSVQRADAESWSAVAPVRKTIQKNPAEHEHQGELQLHNITNSYASSTSVPYFTAGADVGAGRGSAGVLQWAALDTNLSGYDNSSIEIHTIAGIVETGKVVQQIYGFETAASVGVGIEDNDLILFKDISGQNIAYISLVDLIAIIEPFDCDDVYSCLALDNWLCTAVAMCGFITEMNHTDLVDVSGGIYADWDHLGHWQNVDSVAGRCGAASTDYLVNNGQSIGNTSKELIIGLNDQILFDAGGNECLYWDANSVSTSTYCQFIVLNTTGSTSSTTGAAKIAGGLGVVENAYIGGECRADDFKLIDDATNNLWNKESFDVDVTGVAAIEGDGGVTISGTSGSDVGITAGDDLQVSIAGVNTINGSTCDAVLTDGTSSIFRHGWFVNQASWTVQKILTPDGSGGTQEYWTIGKAV